MLLRRELVADLDGVTLGRTVGMIRPDPELSAVAVGGADPGHGKIAIGEARHGLFMIQQRLRGYRRFSQEPALGRETGDVHIRPQPGKLIVVGHQH